MNTAVQIQEVRIKNVNVSDDTITAQIMDKRIISIPLAWSWRLSDAKPKQRAKWIIIGDIDGMHWWPDSDEDIRAEGMLYGVLAPRPMASSRLSPKSEKKKMMCNNGMRPISHKAASL